MPEIIWAAGIVDFPQPETCKDQNARQKVGAAGILIFRRGRGGEGRGPQPNTGQTPDKFGVGSPPARPCGWFLRAERGWHFDFPQRAGRGKIPDKLGVTARAGEPAPSLSGILILARFQPRPPPPPPRFCTQEQLPAVCSKLPRPGSEPEGITSPTHPPVTFLSPLSLSPRLPSPLSSFLTFCHLLTRSFLSPSRHLKLLRLGRALRQRVRLSEGKGSLPLTRTFLAWHSSSQLQLARLHSHARAALVWLLPGHLAVRLRPCFM